MFFKLNDYEPSFLGDKWLLKKVVLYGKIELEINYKKGGMVVNRKLMNPAVLCWSFLVGLAAALTGILLLPLIFEMGTKERQDPQMWISFLLLCLATVTVLVAFKVLSNKIKTVLRPSSSGGVWGDFGGFAVVMLILFAAAIGISIIYGQIAVLIYAVGKNSMETEMIMGIINAVTGFLSLLILPVFSHIVITCLLEDGGVKATFLQGFKSLKRSYFRLLMFLIIMFGIGWVLVIPFRYISNEVLASVLKITVLSFIGAASLPVTFVVYEGGKSK